MKYLKYLALIIGFNLSCSLFKQSTKTTGENKGEYNKTTSIKTGKESAINKEEQLVSFCRDSVRGDYAIRFWPKGDLTFTTDKGFSGQFDSIIMTGKHIRESRNTVIKKAAEQQNNKTNFGKEENLSYNTSQKNEIKKSFNDYLPIFLSLIFVIFGLLWVLRRQKPSLNS
jgi:hypothetical protein